MAQGPPQPAPVQHRFLRAQAASRDPEGSHPAPSQHAAHEACRQSLRAGHRPGATRTALAAAALLVLAGCGNATAPAPHTGATQTGVILLSLHDGAQLGAATLGADPVAVIVSADGRAAYVADSSPGDVYAVTIPALTVMWRQHVGGSPFGLLLHNSRLLVSLFAAGSVLELDLTSGARLASHDVPAGPSVMAVYVMGRVLVAARYGR